MRKVILLATLAVISTTCFSQKIFIKFSDPELTGGSTRERYQDQHEILALSFGASNTTSTSTLGTGATASKVKVSDISFLKNMDKSSPVLFKNCATGKHIDQVVITCLQTSQEGIDDPAYKITLTNVVITSVAVSATGGDCGNCGIGTESITISYGSIKLEHLQSNTVKEHKLATRYN